MATNLPAAVAKAILPGTRRLNYGPAAGGMAEWFKAHAWKACWGSAPRGFKSRSLRHYRSGMLGFSTVFSGFPDRTHKKNYKTSSARRRNRATDRGMTALSYQALTACRLA